MTVERVANDPALVLGETRADGVAADRAGERFRSPRRKPDFETLYATHAGRLLAFLVYRTGDRTLAEDLLADTFERVLRAKRRFDPKRGSETTWLYAIALNCLTDQMRRASSEARAVARSGGQGDDLGRGSVYDEVDDRDLLRRGMANLSNDERLVISLRFGADLTMPEIATLIREPVTTVEARVYRSLGKLRATLGAGPTVD